LRAVRNRTLKFLFADEVAFEVADADLQAALRELLRE
jgi:hypothetical protein